MLWFTPADKMPGFTFALTVLTVALHASYTNVASATEINTGSPDLSVRWDNTVKYNAGVRLKDQSPALLAEYNSDDGNRNFNKGSLITNRIDVLSELDLSYKKSMGFRLSASGWYDQVYNSRTDNTFDKLLNSDAPVGRFNEATKKLHGRDVELLDGFVFMNTELGEMPLTVRAGRHTVLYGETFFFGTNGIANAQGPVDVVKALAVPSSQYKEIARPVNQLSTQLQLNKEVSVAAYYQFEHRKTRIPGSGSYFDDGSFLGAGGNRLYAGPFVVKRLEDKDAKNTGQFGVQTKWRPSGVEAEFGFFAAQYHDSSPQVYTFIGPTGIPVPALSIGPNRYQLVYPEGIRTVGASVNRGVGDFNVGAELSLRDKAPLLNDGVVSPTGSTDLHPLGRTLHLNVSTLGLLPKTALWGGGVVIGEIAWNRVLKVTRNEAGLAANSTRDGLAARVVFEPSFYQVTGGLDLSLPIVVGYNFKGAGQSVFRMTGSPARRGGDFSIGVKGIYNNDIKFALAWNTFLGTEGPPVVGSPPKIAFKNTLADRTNVTFTVSKTF